MARHDEPFHRDLDGLERANPGVVPGPGRGCAAGGATAGAQRTARLRDPRHGAPRSEEPSCWDVTLTDWSAQILASCQVPAEDALQAAQLLVRSELRGYATHGMAR